MQINVLISCVGTARPTKTLMPFEFLNNLHHNTYYHSKRCWLFRNRAQNMINFALRCSSPLLSGTVFSIRQLHNIFVNGAKRITALSFTKRTPHAVDSGEAQNAKCIMGKFWQHMECNTKLNTSIWTQVCFKWRKNVFKMTSHRNT